MNEKIRNLKYISNESTNNEPAFISDLYCKYIQKKLNSEEYIYLLKNTLNKITVYQEQVIFDTKFGIFERKRKIIKRQKGVSFKFNSVDC